MVVRNDRNRYQHSHSGPIIHNVLHRNGHYIRLLQYGGINGNRNTGTGCNSELTKHLRRPDCEPHGRRGYQLYLVRRDHGNRYEYRYCSAFEYRYVYRNRDYIGLFKHSRFNRNGDPIANGNRKFTGDLFRANRKPHGRRRFQLYMVGRNNGNRDQYSRCNTGKHHYLYRYRDGIRLFQYSCFNRNGECIANDHDQLANDLCRRYGALDGEWRNHLYMAIGRDRNEH